MQVTETKTLRQQRRKSAGERGRVAAFWGGDHDSGATATMLLLLLLLLMLLLLLLPRLVMLLLLPLSLVESERFGLKLGL